MPVPLAEELVKPTAVTTTQTELAVPDEEEPLVPCAATQTADSPFVGPQKKHNLRIIGVYDTEMKRYELLLEELYSLETS